MYYCTDERSDKRDDQRSNALGLLQVLETIAELQEEGERMHACMHAVFPHVMHLQYNVLPNIPPTDLYIRIVFHCNAWHEV